MKIGSLCTGYGGLDIAVEHYFNADTLWTSEIDKYASLLIEQRIQKPNLGDLKKVHWEEIPKVDILTAGYPCQPFSHAGYRKGTEDERHLWPYIKNIISILRPRYVVLENVRGHLTLGFREVLGDLASVGYDAKWQLIRASDVGAPHKRERLFVVAYPNGSTLNQPRRANREFRGTPGEIVNETNRKIDGCSGEVACHSNDRREPHLGKVSELGSRFITRRQMSMRTAPNPLDNGKLNARFVEYMMGLPEGWVTDLELSRAQQLKMLGNGVVPQQAYLALQILLEPTDTPKKRG